MRILVSAVVRRLFGGEATMLRRNDVTLYKERQLRIIVPLGIFAYAASPMGGGWGRIICTIGLKKDVFLAAASNAIRKRS